MGPLNNEEVVNPKTKNIRLYVKRVFISDDFDGELVSLLWASKRNFVLHMIKLRHCHDILFYLFKTFFAEEGILKILQPTL